MSEESQQLVASDGGIQTVVPQSTAVSPQIVYLDFDGAETSYNGELLTINDVVVEDSGFDSESITLIVTALNDHFGDVVVFTAELPQTDEYSTIYVGVTSAFEEYGDFLGIAETLDAGNQNHNDNAFVLLNSTASTELVTSVIAHETEHIVGELTHGSGALNAYAEENISIAYINEDYHNLLYDHIANHARLDMELYNYVTQSYYSLIFSNIIVSISWCSECASYPVKIINASSVLISGGRTVNGTNIFNGSRMFVSHGGVATSIRISNGAVADVYAGGTMVNVSVYQGGRLTVHNDAKLSGFMDLNGAVSIANGAIVDFSINLLTDSSQYLINGMEYLNSAENFTCTVKVDQQPGDYYIAHDATFSKTVTLKNTSGTIIGELSINDSIQSDDKKYSLHYLNGGSDLTLSVEANLNYPVKLYDDNNLTSAASSMANVVLKKNADNRMEVSSGGIVINTTVNAETKVEVSSGGVVSSAIINSGGTLNVNDGILKGNIRLGGQLVVIGDSAATDAKIIFDLTQRSPNDGVMVVNLDGIKDATYTISVSSDMKEGKYRLATGVGVIQDLPDKIAFTVDGTMPQGGYEGQYTFNWKSKLETEYNYQYLTHGGYTGINYNGYNYVLSVDSRELCLNVKKNAETMICYLDEDDEKLATSLIEIINTMCDSFVHQVTNNDRCIVVHADSYKNKDYYYTIIGSGTPSAYMQNELTSNKVSSIDQIINMATSSCKSENYSLFVSDHGDGINGLCNDASSSINEKIKITDFASTLTKFNLSSVCFEACLMSSVEVMTVLSKYTTLEYAIASAEVVGNSAYTLLFSDFASGMKNKEQIYFQAMQTNETVSKIQLNKINQLNEHLNQIGKLILEEVDVDDNITWKLIENIIDMSYTYGNWQITKINRFSKNSKGEDLYGSTDLGDFLRNLGIVFNENSRIKNAIDEALKDIRINDNDHVVCQLKTKGEYNQTSGLSVFIPKDNGQELQMIKQIMPANWYHFMERIVEKIDLADAKINTNSDHLNSTIQDENGNMCLGTFSGDGTVFSNLSVGNSGKDFSFAMDNAGEQTDKIILDVQEGADTVSWSLHDADGNKIREGQDSEIGLSGLNIGTYVLNIMADEPSIIDMTFSADWSSAQDYLDDLSPNDTTDTAFEIDGMSMTGLLVSSTEKDWYSWGKGRYPNIITVSSNNATGLLKVSVYDDTGNLVSILNQDSNGNYVFSTSTEGYICVESHDGEKVCYNILSEFDRSIIKNTVTLLGDSSMLNWWNVDTSGLYQIEISMDNFETVVSLDVSGDGLNLLNLPSNSYQWRIGIDELEEWLEGNDITAETYQEAQVLAAEEDGKADAFFVKPLGTWDSTFRARHMGIQGEWDGTGEKVVFGGENRFGDILTGSDDASILLLTDDANGDALFVDDIYSAFPEGLDAQARIAKINEIRAGTGNDLIDLTSQRFEYVGDGVTVKGGLGDDVVWANKGDNWLFGDAGNDRIVGAGGNDVIVGGSGDDSLHGGGGEDIFAFGGNWGNDAVEQLSDGKITLWFDEGSSANWDAANLTYSDGANSVQVSGVTAENVTLKFGEDGSEQYAKLLESGAFDEFSSERIFENKNTRGMLA